MTSENVKIVRSFITLFLIFPHVTFTMKIPHYVSALSVLIFQLFLLCMKLNIQFLIFPPGNYLKKKVLISLIFTIMGE